MNGIGRQQRRILHSLMHGSALINERGRWLCVLVPELKIWADARSCVGLLERGLIMQSSQLGDGRVVYEVTQAGQEAIRA